VKGSDGTSIWCKSSSEPPTSPPNGDLNGDDAITPADVNDDGVVNSLDVLLILQAVIGAITL